MDSKLLDDTMTQIFTHKAIKVVGMDFRNDIKQILLRAPNMQFLNHTNSVHDLSQIFMKVYGFKERSSLSKMTDYCFGDKICKMEQLSNWERKDLRNSQQHYAAVDAYILTKLYTYLDDVCNKKGLNINSLGNGILKCDSESKFESPVKPKIEKAQVSPETHK